MFASLKLPKFTRMLLKKAKLTSLPVVQYIPQIFPERVLVNSMNSQSDNKETNSSFLRLCEKGQTY